MNFLFKNQSKVLVHKHKKGIKSYWGKLRCIYVASAALNEKFHNQNPKE